ncbi:MAG: CPBP family intramembrane metalloprotease [Clostridiales bacterium]|nr:CPBP family intramembrane metalloprotease [Clostridiales bacterium]
MEKLSNQERLRPWMGIVLFAAVMAIFIFAFAPLQQKLGIPGLLITEFGLLAIAVIYCLIRKVKIREVFPVKKVKVREVFGSLLLVLGAFPLSLVLVALTGTIFPWSTKEVGDLSSFLYESLNYPMAVLVVALIPAICEEAIHRGAILSNFRSLKHDWLIVLIMGLFFGINHMSVLRFLTTMFLGMILSYVVVKRNNIILSMLMHFTNNFISVTLTYLLSDFANTSSASTIDYSSLIGGYLVFAFASPILITLGMMLVNPEGHKKIRFLYAGILAAVMFITGITLNVFTSSKSTKGSVTSTVSLEITEEDKVFPTVGFDIDKDCEPTIVLTLTNGEGDYKVRIDGNKGSNVIYAEFPKGTVRTLTYRVRLQPDRYVVTMECGDNAIGETPQLQVSVQ